jgi:deoxyadenosine/deoxycytidine kinase
MSVVVYILVAIIISCVLYTIWRVLHPTKIAWLSLEGNIAAGKTSLIHKLLPLFREKLGHDAVIYVPEPVEEWEASGWLKKSYDNPREHLFTAQCSFFHSRVMQMLRAYNPRAALYISERSPFSDKLFTTTSLKSGRMSEDTYSVYSKMWGLWQDLLPARIRNPTLFVYLKPTLDACQARLKTRSRDAETSVTRDYQAILQAEHDATFGAKHVQMPDRTTVPTLVISTDADFRNSPEDLQAIFEQICDALVK